MKLTLYSRPACHLCDEMLDALQPLQSEFGFSVEKVNVDARPEDKARYGAVIPVLTGPDGQEICRYRLDEAALRDRLALK